MQDLDSLPFSAAEYEFLRAASEAGVPFLVVGLSAAVLQGADTVTQDIDLWFRSVSDPRVASAAVRAGGILIWRTTPPLISGPDLDRIDLVVHCHGLDDFDSEFARAVTIEVCGIPLKVLPLDRVIASKRAANRAKDQAVMPALEAALAATAQKI
ncbi:MAG: hypothetical protein SF187_15735 [Deltaproteobacteria bacterium]|nr:hypothetical protein [Deltaproteobacteria bacterium]